MKPIVKLPYIIKAGDIVECTIKPIETVIPIVVRIVWLDEKKDLITLTDDLYTPLKELLSSDLKIYRLSEVYVDRKISINDIVLNNVYQLIEKDLKLDFDSLASPTRRKLVDPKTGEFLINPCEEIPLQTDYFI